MDQASVAIISAFTALCAVVLAPLVSIYSVRRQTGVSVLSNNRQNWINTLRDSVSEYTTLVTFVHVGNYGNRESILDKIERAHQLMVKVQLLLNPSEDDHIELIELMEKGTQSISCGKEERDSKEWDKIKKDIISVSQVVLKREWNRVKKIA